MGTINGKRPRGDLGTGGWIRSNQTYKNVLQDQDQWKVKIERGDGKYLKQQRPEMGYKSQRRRRYIYVYVLHGDSFWNSGYVISVEHYPDK